MIPFSSPAITGNEEKYIKEAIEIEVLPDERIMLIPMANVPKHQLWAWTPENQKKVRDSLRDPRPSVVIETEKDVKAVTKRWSTVAFRADNCT